MARVACAEGEQLRLVGLLDRDDQSAASGVLREAFRERLKELGWIEGRNLKIRHIVSDATRMWASAAELVLLGPEVIVAGSAAQARALKESNSEHTHRVRERRRSGCQWISREAQPSGSQCHRV